MEKLLCSRMPDQERLNKLHDLGIELIKYDRLHMESDEAFIQQVQGFSYVISGPGRWNKNVLQAVQGSLRMAIKFGVGVDNFDLAAATRAGIAVANAPGSNSAAVAEHTIALMLAILRQLEQASTGVKAGKWGGVRCDTLIERTVGLFGFGSIAQHVAKYLSGFPVKIKAYDIMPWEPGSFGAVEFVSLDELLSTSDLVSLHAPLNDATAGIVDQEFLARMKKGSYLINTARGGLVNEQDLAQALRTGQLKGAGLDTLDPEPPLADNPLLQLENVILSPHCASGTEQAYRKILESCIDNIIAFKSGQGKANILNSDYIKYVNQQA